MTNDIARSGEPASSRIRRAVGCFYLFTGGVHLGIVAADPQYYRSFADPAYFPLIRDAWQAVFMAQPGWWGLALMGGEVVLGLLLLAGGPAVRIGWAGVIAFHVLLMLFGFGFWLWSVPVLLFLVPAARADWPRLSSR